MTIQSLMSNLLICTNKIKTYRNVGIILISVSSTVTSPFSGKWFAVISCLIADILILKSLWTSVLPRTPFRSKNKQRDVVKCQSHLFYTCKRRHLPGHSNTKLWYRANSVSVNFSTAIPFAVSNIFATNFISNESEV